MKKTTEKDKKKISRSTTIRVKRAFYIVLFAGNTASAIMLALLISNPETGMFVLAGFNTVSAGYFIFKAIE